MSRGPYPILLMLAMSLPSAVRAIGLGDIRVNSALDEPLSAQIDIVGATREELVALTATVANRDIFQRYGADRPSFLSSATFKVGLDAAGRPVLNVRSAEAFTDPVVSFLVDLRWGKNDIVREYSLLLDPPGYAAPRPAADVASVAAAPAVPASPAVTPARETPPVARSPVRVAAGDTLRGIARRAGASNAAQVETLMIAIFRTNPGAFDGNINRLHRGAVLEIPTPAEYADLSTADARREVRAHMTAWRLQGRPAAPHAVAATIETSAPPALAGAQTVPDAALKNRVQSLELALDDLHQQLASEDAKIQDLKRSAATAPVATEEPIASVESSMAGPAVAAAMPHTTAVPVPATPPTSASLLAPAATAAPAELVQAPIVPPSHPVEVTTTVAAPRTPRSAEFFGPVAVALGLLVAGIALVRRRVVRAVTIPDYAAMPAVAAAPAPTRGTLTVASDVKSVSAPAQEVAKAAPAFQAADMAQLLDSPPPPQAHYTGTTEIVDIEALERSYLESLPIDPSALETTTVETLGIDATVAQPAADFNLADLDATAQHVHMPSALHDHPVMTERRTNIVDVLKMAIERDPERRDLRMKLLETYYSVASTNQRAFLEIVRKLSREKDSLSTDDWKKVMMMGREIAADDIFFAELPGGAGLANCA